MARLACPPNRNLLFRATIKIETLRVANDNVKQLILMLSHWHTIILVMESRTSAQPVARRTHGGLHTAFEEQATGVRLIAHEDLSSKLSSHVGSCQMLFKGSAALLIPR